MADSTRWQEIQATVNPPTWLDLLHALNTEILAADEITQGLAGELVEAGWLGYPGAGVAEIEAAEARLGRTLPPSYRDFLVASNGWRCLNSFEVKLLPTTGIDWLCVVDPQLVKLWQEFPKFAAPSDEVYFDYSLNENDHNFRAEHIRDMLVVSTQGWATTEYVWLNPSVIAADGEWEAWYFVPGEGSATRHRTFRDLILHELHWLTHNRYFPA